MMMESNISKDHIALEAMKVIMAKNVIVEETLWSKIKYYLFGGERDITIKNINHYRCAENAYMYAEAMIAEREKRESDGSRQEEA